MTFDENTLEVLKRNKFSGIQKGVFEGTCGRKMKSYKDVFFSPVHSCLPIRCMEEGLVKTVFFIFLSSFLFLLKCKFCCYIISNCKSPFLHSTQEKFKEKKKKLHNNTEKKGGAPLFVMYFNEIFIKKTFVRTLSEAGLI